MAPQQIESAKRRAWIETRFGDKDPSDEEINHYPCPSDNFSDGFDAGLSFAGQWTSIDDALPECDDEVLVYAHKSFTGSDQYAIAYWDGEDWYTTDGEHIRPSHWFTIPHLNPEKVKI